MRKGILGGTFDPPHIGHVIVAEHVRTSLQLDTIIFVPAHTPPHKQGRAISSPDHRLAMVNLAVRENRSFAVSDMEIVRGGISYSVDTLKEMTQRFPGDEFYLLIGADNVAEFSTWKSPDAITRLSTVVVMTRPGFDAESARVILHDRFILCQVPEIDVTSSQIRERVLSGMSIQDLVPGAVEEYILREHLYRR